MTLYHYTSAQHLRGIFKFGLTVGDVPTDIERNLGKVGVWLTTVPTPEGHGLAGSAVDKSRYRLAVDIADYAPQLHRWAEWATHNATPYTVTVLNGVAANECGRAHFDTWLIYFGMISTASILNCTDMHTGVPVENWGGIMSKTESLPGVPFWCRHKWHRKLLKKIARQSKASVF